MSDNPRGTPKSAARKRQFEKAVAHLDKIVKPKTKAEIRNEGERALRALNAEGELLIQDVRKHQLEKARAHLDEIDRLIKILRGYGLNIDETLGEDYFRALDAYRDAINGKITIEEALGAEIAQVAVPERFAEEWETHGQLIVDFLERTIRRGKYSRPRDIDKIVAKIEEKTLEIAEISANADFAEYIENSLYAELYKYIKQKTKGKKLSSEMEDKIAEVLDKAIVMGGGGRGEKPAEEKEVEEGEEDINIDPLLTLSERLDEKVAMPEATEGEMAFVKGSDSIITGESFMLPIEEQELPAEVLAELNSSLEEMEGEAMRANPVQEAVLNLCAVYVIKPLFKEIAEMTDYSLMRLAAKKGLLLIRRELANAFDDVEDVANTATLGISIIKAGVSTLNAFPGVNIVLGSDFEIACDTIRAMVDSIEDVGNMDSLTVIMNRNPESVAESRKSGRYSFERLRALTFLMLRLRDENKSNPALVIGLQFATQILIRVYNDDELMKAAPAIRQSIKTVMDKHGAKLTEDTIAEGLGSEEIDSLLGIILPTSTSTSPQREQMKTSVQYQKIDRILSKVEGLVTKDKERFGNYNIVVLCLVENIREYLLDPNAEEKLKRDWQTLRGLITKVAGEQLPQDPLLQIAMENPDIIEAAITGFYGGAKDGLFEQIAGKDKDRSQLKRLEAVLRGYLEEYKDDEHKREGLEMAILMIAGYKSDKKFFENVPHFAKIIDELLFDERYLGLELNASAKRTFGAIAGYRPQESYRVDEEELAKLQAAIGPLEELATLSESELHDKASIYFKNPEVREICYVFAALQNEIEKMVTEELGDRFGEKEKALFAYAMENYKNHLCDRYNNSVADFLVEIEWGLPPDVSLKRENIIAEASSIGAIVDAIAGKMGKPELVGEVDRLVKSHLTGAGQLAMLNAKSDEHEA